MILPRRRDRASSCGLIGYSKSSFIHTVIPNTPVSALSHGLLGTANQLGRHGTLLHESPTLLRRRPLATDREQLLKHKSLTVF
jgi:hypothetical protein